MKIQSLIAVACASIALSAVADINYYVSLEGDGSDPTSGDWSKAFPHPQDAIDMADGVTPVTVVVGEGTYGLYPTNISVMVITTPSGKATTNYFNEGYVINITNSNITVKSAPGKVVTLDGGVSMGATSTRAINITSGLTDVAVSGFRIINGYNQQNQRPNQVPTSIFARSGLLENLEIHGYSRSRNQFVILDGDAMMRDCTLDEPSRYNNYPNSFNNNPIYIKGSALLENTKISGIPYCSNGNEFFQGIYVDSANATVRGCIVAGITNGPSSKTVATGAGIYLANGTVENCTVVDCFAYGKGGGIYVKNKNAIVKNCIFHNNIATVEGNDVYLEATTSGGKTYYPTMEYCAGSDVDTTKPGNITANPKLLADGSFGLELTSPCTGSGIVLDWMSAANDIAGNDRLWTDGTVSMGAVEPQGRYLGVLVNISVEGGVSLGRAPFAVSFVSVLIGAAGNAEYQWDFGDGQTSTEANPTHIYETVGRYSVSLSVTVDGHSYSSEVQTDLVTVVGPKCYVKKDNVGVIPYDTWEKAAGDIDSALALKPAEIVVTNGTYTYAGVDTLTINTDCRIHSVEGPGKTFLDAGHASCLAWTASHTAVNLVHDGAVLEGFSLIRGSNRMVTADKGLISHCVITNCPGIARTYLFSLSGTARIEDCVFDATDMSISDAYQDMARSLLRLEGAAVADRCVFRNYRYTSTSSQDFVVAAPVALYGTAAIRNSLVERCTVNANEATANSLPTVYATDNARVENCSFLCNTNKSVSGVAKGGNFVNCLFSGNSPSDHVFAAEPTSFRNCAVDAGCTLPECATNCVFLVSGKEGQNNGILLDWMSEPGCMDLLGRPRVVWKPDIGCYESAFEPGLMLFVR